MSPIGAETVSVDVVDPGSVRVEGVNTASSPDGKEALRRETTPEKPPKGFSVMVELFEPPAKTIRNNGLAEAVKPGPFTVTMIPRNCTSGPLLASTSSV